MLYQTDYIDLLVLLSTFIETLKQRQLWFSADSDRAVIATLQKESQHSDDAAALLKQLQAVSPYAVAVSRRMLEEAKQHNLAV